MVDIKVSKYKRISPETTVIDAKICGHYVGGILSAVELDGTHYHEALFLDHDENIAEGGGENFFIIKDKLSKGCYLLPGLARIGKPPTVTCFVDDIEVFAAASKRRIDPLFDHSQPRGTVRIAQTNHAVSFVGRHRVFIRETNRHIERRYRPSDVRN